MVADILGAPKRARYHLVTSAHDFNIKRLFLRMRETTTTSGTEVTAVRGLSPRRGGHANRNKHAANSGLMTFHDATLRHWH